LVEFDAPLIEAELAISCIGARPRAELAFLALQRAFRLFFPNQGKDEGHDAIRGDLEFAVRSHANTLAMMRPRNKPTRKESR